MKIASQQIILFLFNIRLIFSGFDDFLAFMKKVTDLGWLHSLDLHIMK